MQAVVGTVTEIVMSQTVAGTGSAENPKQNRGIESPLGSRLCRNMKQCLRTLCLESAHQRDPTEDLRIPRVASSLPTNLPPYPL